MNPARIVIVGSVNMDLVLRCGVLPRPGETVAGQSFDTHPGGKGANQAVAAARQGAAVAFVGAVGDDAFGPVARQALAVEGLELSQLATLPGQTTGVAMILVEHSGQNCIALAPGANAAVNAERVRAAESAVAGAALLVCQLETPLDGVRQAVALARRHGVPVLLNPAPAQPLPDALLAEIDVLVPNETEAALLLGLPPGAPLEAEAAALALRERGVGLVIITLGGDGLCVADADGVRRLPAPRVTPVDTTGAGDTFIGAYAAARVAGLPLGEALVRAQQAAALGVTRPGAMASMPTRAECEAHFAAAGPASAGDAPRST